MDVDTNTPRLGLISHVRTVLLTVYRWFVEKVRAMQKRRADQSKRRRKRLYEIMRHSEVFFSYRFGDAFPGCRDTLIIDDPAEAVRRLDILLRDPICIEIGQKDGSTRASPIFWFRGGMNYHVDTYKRLRKWIFLPTRDILLNGVEIHRVRRVAAFGSMSYAAKAVYVETEGVPPSGLYHRQPSKYAEDRGYEYEEVGIYKGHFIKREEYDDGAAVIKGNVVRPLKNVKLQVRYITPFNFLIIPIESRINNKQYDCLFETALKKILKQEVTIHELAALVRTPFQTKIYSSR